MSTNIKLKEAFEVESKYGAFFTGGNVEWLTENILLCQNESTIQFLDTATGSVTITLGGTTNDEPQEEDADTIITFTSNSSAIVTAHKSGLIKLWTLDGALARTWKSIHKGPISKMCLDTQNRLATGGSDGIVRLWDTKHQSCTHSLRGCQGVVSTVVFHPTKNVLYASGDDNKIHSWDLNTSQAVKEYAGHFSKVTSVIFNHDGKHMVSTSRDKVVILWDIEAGSSIKTLPVFEALESVILLPESFELFNKKYKSGGLYVATAGEKGTIRIWNLLSSKEIYSQTNSLVPPCKEEGGLSITKLLYNESKGEFCVVTVDQNIILYKFENFEVSKQFVGFTDEILDICFVGNNDSHVAVATNSSDIKLYEYSTMNCSLLQGHTDIVLALAKTLANPNLFLSSGKDNSIRLWSLNDENKAECLGVGTKHTGSVGSIAFSQTVVKFAVSVSEDTCLKMWDIPEKPSGNETLECMRTEIAHQKDINCVTVSPNDKIIATGSQDKFCKLWNENLELVGVLRGHKRGIWSVRFSPVDQVIVTSSADCTVKLWSITELNCLKTLQGHEASVLKLEFLSNGMQILTAGADGLLKVFSIKTSDCSMTLDEHDGRVWALAVKSDKSVVMSGGSDSLLVKWKDVTLQKRLEKIKADEEFTLQEQELSNLIQSNELLKALKLALRLDRPFQTLKIIEGVLKKSDTGLSNTISELSNDQKEKLLDCVTAWNTNAKHCQPAQLVLNILIHELQTGAFRPQGLSNIIEATLPYTERHFKRLTQLQQDLNFINYTVNCMQPFAKNLE